MRVEQLPDGWFIHHNNRFYHVNQEWLDEMFRHQVKPYGNNPAYNLLLHAFQTGADADEIVARFETFMTGRKQNQHVVRGKGGSERHDPEFRKSIRRARGNSR